MWQYYRDEPNDNFADSESFKSKIIVTGKTPNGGNEKDVEIMVPLKYLSKFWRTLEMPLISFEHGHQLVLLLILQVQEHLKYRIQNYMFL